ncbi:MAG TPA: hypothetical protein EYQ73_02570 [Candidatus Poseidoniales archaeon]|jgi:hypothetical protein|nr:hypothetical protein [Candidatus Poseidoniales archaeon]HIL64893.1 hypothetical protein [Candidatus Poseidoniales archaeon]
MSDKVEGASMPDGIEVDEAAAYFGVFASSDALHQMMEMPREQAFERFFALLSDLVLKAGEFDFELASQRLACEGGEIYFLVAGHLGVMSMPEQLSLALSEGQFSQTDADRLQPLADPMRLLKLFAIAYQTGGDGEATKYLKGMESIFGEPVRNKDALLVLASDLQAAFDVGGHVMPIPSLASSSAVASQIEAADVAPLPTSIPQVKPEPVKRAEPIIATKPEPVSVPLPNEEISVPLPQLDEPKVIVDDRKDTEKTEDAFSGAFSFSEPEKVVKPEPVSKPEPVVIEEVQSTAIIEEEVEEEIDEEVSLEEAFAAADVDGSGGLSVEEVAEATGLDIEEAAILHAEADVDGDGQVTLEELKAKPEVATKMALPKPVKPVARPIQPQPSPAQLQQQALQIQAAEQQKLLEQQRLQQQAWQQQQLQQQQLQQQQLQQQMQQQQAPQQQGWGQPTQPMQPTIRSGISCRGCRIGVDPNWKFCPVCGTQNR